MRWFPFINLLFASLIAVILFLTFLLAIPKKDAWSPPATLDTPKTLPKSSFESNSLEGFHQGPFALKWSEPKMQLPDLQNVLVFYGLMQRPDVEPGKTLIHLSLAGQEEIVAFDVEKPIYLTYKRKSSTGQGRIFSQTGESENDSAYHFSENNSESPLWLDVALRGNSLEVKVNMLDERGEIVTSPAHFHLLHLTAHEIPRLKALGWELDSSRVDSTLLIRQKARWIGQDLFLEKHGGEEFAAVAAKERIDFLVEEPYSCFIKEGSFLVWEEGRWHEAEGRETIGRPLLVVKKKEERLITLELWDPQGKGKTLLTLVRSKDLAGFPNLDEEFKFIGAKTWAKFIVESHNARMILKPHDWLVLTEKGWVQLNSSDLIDDYVEQRLQGPLLVLSKLTKQNGKQVLTGHLFNTSRTEMETIELATTSNMTLASSYTLPPPSAVKCNNNFDFEGDTE